MNWDLDGHEAIAYLAAAFMALLAAVLLHTNRHKAQNRWFVALLALEFMLAVSASSIAVTTEQRVADMAAAVFMLVLPFALPVYLGFLSTLGTSVSRALRRPFLRAIPWAFPATAIIAAVFAPSRLFGQPDPTAQDLWPTTGGPLLFPYQLASILAAFVGLVTAILYWRTSPRGTAMRKQGAVFALAFGLHDAGMIASIVLGLVASARDSALLFDLAYYGIPLTKFVLLSLVSYGILRVQLFDIDLKIKWTLGRGAAVALLTSIFFIISETIEFFLPGEGLVANLVGAAAVAGLVRPAWRLGTRLANAVLPGVVETPEFRQQRRLEVYRASLESVAADGLVTERERRILETLRTKLGIGAEEAATIEREVMTVLPSGRQPTAGQARLAE
jgi:hypothetical protein